ncbi:hypothetical protein DXG01_008845 [Tephrocybe rancida]|nr:hypothetical protein DXG01_008845 [Tephrocybe rancida]
MVTKENEHLQDGSNDNGRILRRTLDPDCFLPTHASLDIYPAELPASPSSTPVTQPQPQPYVIASDGILRTSTSPSSPCFPPFSGAPLSPHAPGGGLDVLAALNPFLVALDAASKFKNAHRHVSFKEALASLPKSALLPIPEAGTPGREAVLVRKESALWDEQEEKVAQAILGGDFKLAAQLNSQKIEEFGDQDVERLVREDGLNEWHLMKRRL